MEGGRGRSAPAKEGTRRVAACDVEHFGLVKIFIGRGKGIPNIEKNEFFGYWVVQELRSVKVLLIMALNFFF